MDKFIAGYHQFRDSYFNQNKDFLKALMGRPQTPKAMMISCSDSRIDPGLKFGAEPGDIFMVRNVANLVPPYAPDGDYHGTSAALEFAVQVLEVENIVVMGHARCGGIGALVRHQEQSALDFVAAWMKIAMPALERASKQATGEAALQRACEQEAVKESLKNLMTFPWVKARVEAGKLAIHGWYFDLETGTLHRLNKSGAFEAV
ncbi:MAG: carbonic anhydrase [Rhodospirillaceae bacterium]|nr:carbonic anhydrase [Rhodospirillaceae bacterium]